MWERTSAIIRLWRLASKDGNVVSVSQVEDRLKPGLEDKLVFLQCSSVEDMLWQYMKPDEEGNMSFLQFWLGIEEIARACNADQKAIPLRGFRYVRKRLLEMSSQNNVFSMRQVRSLMQEAGDIPGPEGSTFWRAKAVSLPDNEVCVMCEEVVSVVLSWLEELTEPLDHEIAPHAGSMLEDVFKTGKDVFATGNLSLAMSFNWEIEAEPSPVPHCFEDSALRREVIAQSPQQSAGPGLQGTLGKIQEYLKAHPTEAGMCLKALQAGLIPKLMALAETSMPQESPQLVWQDPESYSFPQACDGGA